MLKRKKTIFTSKMYDFIIASYFVISFMIILSTENIMLMSLILFTTLVIFWGSFIEPHIIKISKFNLKFKKNTGNDLKICFFADLHLGPYKRKKFIKKITKIINKEKPDLILIGGDFIYHENTDIEHIHHLKSIATNFPTYAVLGNHEYHIDFEGKFPPDYEKASLVKEALEKNNIQVLMDENKIINIQGKKINLIGFNEVLLHKNDISKGFSTLDKNSPNIILVHNADLALEIKNQQIDLMLSGHTHGGQIRLPFIGPVPPIPAKLGRKYSKGFYKINNIPVFITSGIGESGPRSRLFCPPEIVFFNIQI